MSSDPNAPRAATYLATGTAAASRSWQLPPGVVFDLQSVYAVIDASGAGADVTAELTITDISGAVIAKKPQGNTIPAGGSGSATFALRLDGDDLTSALGPYLHWGNNVDTHLLGLILNTTQKDITIESLGPDVGQLVKLQSGGQITLLAGSQLLLDGSTVILDGTSSVLIEGPNVETLSGNIEERITAGVGHLWRVCDAGGVTILSVTNGPIIDALADLNMHGHNISNVANLTTSVFGRTGTVVAANGDYGGVVASFLTGATQAARFAGATASGAPVSGTFAVGDFVVDQTGQMWICTVAGTPGTWASTVAAGVSSFAKSGSTALIGAVTISAGAGVTLTQLGQNVAIAASASGSGSEDGWLDDTGETWTYATGSGGGAASFTVTGDVTTKYTAGTRVKLTQTTVKYFVVTSSTVAAGTTTVNIMAGSDYTLANAAISLNYHSYAVNPQGWPTWFTWAPTIVGFSGTPSTEYARFAMLGKMVTCRFGCNGTSNSTSFTFTLPVSRSTTGGANDPWFPAMIRNNGTFSVGSFAPNGSSSTTMTFFVGIASAFTNTGAKSGYALFDYEAA